MKKQNLQYWIFVADLAGIGLAMLLAYMLRYGITWGESTPTRFAKFVSPLLAAVLLWLPIFFGMRLDGFRTGWHPPAMVSQLILAVGFLMSILLAVGYLFQVFFSRLTLVYFGIFLFLIFVLVRYSTHTLLSSRLFTRAVRRVLIVGNGPVAREMALKIERHPEVLCKVVGFLFSADSSFDQQSSLGETGVPNTLQTLGVIDLIKKERVDEVIITLSKPAVSEVMNLAARCRKEGIGVSIVPHPYELYLSKPQLIDVGGIPLLRLRDADSKWAHHQGKRLVDLVFATVLLVLSLPLILIGAVVLIHKSGGPFVRELRCGKSGRLFRMWRLNSDRDSTSLPSYEVKLQQLSITELPQLWNVLIGEMSLVGPRPESPDRVKHYSDWQRRRLEVKPGITGLAQVHGLREQHSSEEKSRFDLQYMMHATFFLDISLLLQTVWTLIGRLFGFYRSSPGTPLAPQRLTNQRPIFEEGISGAHRSQSSAD